MTDLSITIETEFPPEEIAPVVEAILERIISKQ